MMRTPADDLMNAKEDSPRARLNALAPERRAQLLDPAEAEFAQNGFNAASLNRILASAGMSKGQAYYYIADKADLYRAVMERALGRLIGAIGPVSLQPRYPDEFWTQIENYLARMSQVLKQDGRLAALARGIYESSQSRDALGQTLADLRNLIGRLVLDGQQIGAIRTDLPLSLLTAVLSSAAREIDRWFAMHWDELDANEAIRLNEKAVDMLRRLAEPPDQH